MTKAKSKSKFRIKKNDFVQVITGKQLGKQGKVLKIFPKKQQVIVEGLNFISRHTKPSNKNRQGGIIEKEGPLHISNVMIVCPSCKKQTRVKMKKLVEDALELNRVCARCGELLDK